MRPWLPASHSNCKAAPAIQRALVAGAVGSYGSTKRYKSFERLTKVNGATVLGAGGELSDFQYIQTLLDELATEDYCADDGIQLTPREVYAYLSRVLYNRRNKCAPARCLVRFMVWQGCHRDPQGIVRVHVFCSSQQTPVT